MYPLSAFASSVAINLVPKYARSAPIAKAPAIECPSPMDPDNKTVPSNHSLTSRTKEKGERLPAWPPAPAQTKIRPSTPCSAAFFACFTLITS